jgi:3-oxoacyl-[acyl-carrier protein] reductase
MSLPRALITGSSRGLGAAVGKALASEGFMVVLNYRTRPEEAQAVVDEIRARGGSAIAVQADVSKKDGLLELWDKASEGGKEQISVFVQNAGVLGPGLTTIEDTSDELLTSILDTNVKSVLWGLQLAAKHMPPGGRIINISSTSVATRPWGYGAYAASKAAVETLTSIAAKELAPKGLTVNAVAPGPFESELFFDGKSPELIAKMAETCPHKRIGKVDDLVPMVVFLASKESGVWTTGQTIRLNGGVA